MIWFYVKIILALPLLGALLFLFVALGRGIIKGVREGRSAESGEPPGARADEDESGEG
jgi:hypothetical protein